MEMIYRKQYCDVEEDDRVKWIKYYCSKHEILLVGEGDFSFSLCLAMSFASASHITATSFDSYDDLMNKYKKAKSNLKNLKDLGATVLHGVDATKMKYHTDLFMRKFDRIIFNFPHAGFHGKEDNVLMIRMHKRLVYEFFKNASQMLRANGEIHVNHKTKAPFCNWDIIQLASQNSLLLIGCADFKKEDYPGYTNKRGDGHSCDIPFHLGACSTYIFSFNHRVAKTPIMQMNTMNRTLNFQEIQTSNQRYPISFEPNYPQTSNQRYPISFEPNYPQTSRCYQPTSFEPKYPQATRFIDTHNYQSPSSVFCMNPSFRTHDRVSQNVAEGYARNPSFERFPVNILGSITHDRFIAEIPETTVNGELYVSREYHRLNMLRSMIRQKWSSNYGERTNELFHYR